MALRGSSRPLRDLSDTEEMDEDDYDSDATNMSVESQDFIGEETEDVATEDEPDSDVLVHQEGSPILERRMSTSQEVRNYVTQARTRRRILEIPTDSEESEPVVAAVDQDESSTSPEPPGEPPSVSPQHIPPRNEPPSPQFHLDTSSPQSAPIIEVSSEPVPQFQLPHSGDETGSALDQPSTSTAAREEIMPQNSPGDSPSGSPCTSPKKPEQAVSAIPSTPESDDEGQTCTICFEHWNNSGNHRLVSLKCGHFFGQDCIEKWLRGPKGKCPQCNAKASKRDIRVHFVKSLKAIDTAERDRVLQELEKEREAKRRQEVEHAQTKLKYELKAQLVVKLQEELKLLRNAAAGIASSQGRSFSSGSEGTHGKLRLTMHSGVDIIKDGGCRVMAYNEWLTMLVVSMPSQVAMFPGFGVKKLNILDMKPDRYVPLHQKQIRDIAFNPVKNDLLLSVAMDKMVKLTNICSNTPVASYQADSPLWSCCWSADNANHFFVGTALGSVIQYDTRNTSSPVQTIKVAGSGPVVSLNYIPYCCSANFSSGGLLVARLQSCSFVEIKDDGAQDHTLPLEGPFTSVSVETSTRHILVSCRPCQKFPHARHLVCELQSVDISTDPSVVNRIVTSNIVHSFKGGTTQTVLSRTCAMINPTQAGSVLVCANDESTQSTCVWDLATTSCFQQIKCSETVIDILPVKSNQYVYLTLLTDKSVKFYKWVDNL